MLDTQTLLAHLVQVVEEDGFKAHAIEVSTRHGTARRCWGEDVRRDVHSVAKGVCVLAAGIACDEGLFDPDAPLAHYLPDLTSGPGVDSVTTRHLLGMVSGIDLPWSATMMTDWPDLAAEFLRRPSRGRAFQYSNASTYTAMRALSSVVGDVHAWLTPRLFAPLGIEAPNWDRCPNGHVLAGEGLHLSIGEFSRIGQLIHARGAWRNRQLVSPRWIEALHSDWHVRVADPGYTHYALAGWGGPGTAWRLHGAHGQMLLFHRDAVIAVMADDHLGADRTAAHLIQVLD